MITRASVGDLSEGTSIVHGYALRPDASDLDANPSKPGLWPRGPAGSSKPDLSPAVTANGG
jgi:hypothetical protein